MVPEQAARKKIGVLIGGSGLIGGTLVHYFKTTTPDKIEIRAPSSKKLSIRSQDDIRNYFNEVTPDFIINTAITNLNSDSQLSFEVNCLGAVNLAKAAAAHNIPYIHMTTAAALPYGSDLSDDDTLPLTADLSNYAKSKLMAEKSLIHLQKEKGLDYSSLRLAIVYGDHDHKIQGFHRLFFSIAEQSMPFLFTAKGVKHSYSNSRKVPYLVHHMLENRMEFSGQTYNFVDPEPVELAKLILTIKKYLRLNSPRELYIPYGSAKFGRQALSLFLRAFAKLGLIARMPPELMFLESFYKTQSLSVKKLQASSYQDPKPGESIFSLLPDLASYYLKRWSQQNLLTVPGMISQGSNEDSKGFQDNPIALLEEIKMNIIDSPRQTED